jgi:hypothetical protein
MYNNIILAKQYGFIKIFIAYRRHWGGLYQERHREFESVKMAIEINI